MVPVRRSDGSEAVLKIPVVDEENLAEATALFHYDGDGTVRLYEFDPDSGAMLLEYALPGAPLIPQGLDGLHGAHREGLPDNVERIDRACAMYRRPRRRDSPNCPDASRLAARWAVRLPARAQVLGTAVIPADLVSRLAELCAGPSTSDGPEGVVNRDTHLGNIVSAQCEPWLLIDPKPLRGERAFDAGFLLSIQVELLPDRATVSSMVARTADGLGVTPHRARGWAFIRAMDNAICAAEDSGPALARYLATARLLR